MSKFKVGDKVRSKLVIEDTKYTVQSLQDNGRMFLVGYLHLRDERDFTLVKPKKPKLNLPILCKHSLFADWSTCILIRGSKGMVSVLEGNGVFGADAWTDKEVRKMLKKGNWTVLSSGNVDYTPED